MNEAIDEENIMTLLLLLFEKKNGFWRYWCQNYGKLTEMRAVLMSRVNIELWAIKLNCHWKAGGMDEWV